MFQCFHLKINNFFGLLPTLSQFLLLHFHRPDKKTILPIFSQYTFIFPTRRLRFSTIDTYLHLVFVLYIVQFTIQSLYYKSYKIFSIYIYFKTQKKKKVKYFFFEYVEVYEESTEVPLILSGANFSRVFFSPII